MPSNDLNKHLFLINKKIADTCETYKRNLLDVCLIAVSKTISVEKITEAILLGCKNFGENYIQEAKEKWHEIRKEFPQIKLHLIGHLQSNKTSEAVALFDSIHSLDSRKLALLLKKEMTKQSKNLEIFIQVNIGEESQKDGVLPGELSDFIRFTRNECGLNIAGLMCIPPSDEFSSPYFALLAKLAYENDLKKLSMGMSGDFVEAVALGATHVRIGRALWERL